MTLLDLAIIAGYLGCTLLLSAWLARTITAPDAYYVAGRAMPWWALALSTTATQSSANSFIGIPAFVALVPGGGLTWLQYELAVPLGILVVMVVLVPVFRGLGLVSIYEYLEIRFDRPTRLLLSGVFLISRAAATGVALYAAAVVVQVCTGLPLTASVLTMGGVTVVYDMLGGMRAVVWTDVLQMVVLLGGIAVCAAFGWTAAGGWAGLIHDVGPARPGCTPSTGRMVSVMARGHRSGDFSSAALCCMWPITASIRPRCSANSAREMSGTHKGFWRPMRWPGSP